MYHKMMEDQEDAFYNDGGIYEQIHDRIEAYIKENRDLTPTPKMNMNLSWEEVEKLSEHKAGTYRNYVSYSAYDDTYTDNLDEVAVEGRVQFVEEVDIPNEIGMVMGNVPYDTRENYTSPVMENPTWLEVALLANDMINATGDNHHIYLEAIYLDKDKFTLDDKSFVKIYRFAMGS